MTSEAVAEPTQAEETAGTQPEGGVTGADLLAALDDSSEDAPESQGTEGQPDNNEAIEPETRAAIEERIRAELEEQTKQGESKRLEEEATRKAAEASKRERDERKAKFQDAAPNLRTFMENIVQQGNALTQADVNGVLNWFTEFNGAVDTILGDAQADRLYDAAAQALPESQRAAFLAKRDEHDGKGEEKFSAFFSDLATGLVEQSREGYVKKSDALKDVEDKLLKQFRRLQENPSLLTSQVAGARDHTGGRADSRSDEEILADPNTPVEKLMEIRNRQRGLG